MSKNSKAVVILAVISLLAAIGTMAFETRSSEFENAAPMQMAPSCEWTPAQAIERIRDLEKRTAQLQETIVAMEEAIGKAEQMTGKRLYKKPNR